MASRVASPTEQRNNFNGQHSTDLDKRRKQNMCIIVYDSGIIFFEEYIHILTYSILAYAYSRILGQSTASLPSLFHQLMPNTKNSAAKPVY